VVLSVGDLEHNNHTECFTERGIPSTMKAALSPNTVVSQGPSRYVDSLAKAGFCVSPKTRDSAKHFRKNLMKRRNNCGLEKGTENSWGALSQTIDESELSSF
jgi:hypothetical protein